MDTIAWERMQRTITPRQFALMNAELVEQLATVERETATTGGPSALREFKEPRPARGTGATRRDSRAPDHDHTPKRRSETEVKITNDDSPGRPSHPVNDQGR